MLTTLAKLSLAQERGLILVVEVRGIVKLKRSQWKSYQTVYGTELARERYLIALKLANSENDLARQAIIQDSLGEVDITLDQLKSAIQWFEKAQNNYRALGDQAKVQKMQQQLDDLKKRID